MIFYRNLLKAAIQLDPDQTMRAITEVVKTFEMPGADIPGFQRKAVEMAIAGIYDLRQHRDDVVMPVLRFWKVFDVEGLSAEGEQARDRAVGVPRRPRRTGVAVRGQAGPAEGSARRPPLTASREVNPRPTPRQNRAAGDVSAGTPEGLGGSNRCRGHCPGR